ncbi:MAG: M20 family metallopeptidase [Myxococcales bacterium]|nr:M20 family metallopeptidase [Myxococcales bacterium]
MSDHLEDATAKCTHLALTVLDTLRPWVECNSYSGSVSGVNAMGDLLAADFDLPGLRLQRHAGNGVGDHLVFTTPAFDTAQPSERILLIGHHDTVFPPGSFEEWTLEGDNLRGPGVLDMKGGLVTIHLAFKTFASLGILEQLPVAFVCVGDEEIGSKDSAAMVLEVAAGAGGALVFEAGRAADAIITQRKGTGALKVSVEGVAAHAGNHHKEGKNAILALSKFIVEVQALTDYDKGVTVNVGLISGGEARNTVPHFAECHVDFRLIRREDGEQLVKTVQALADRVAKESSTSFSVSGGVSRPPLERSEASADLCARYAEAAKASGLGYEEALLIGGGSDANNVSAIGVPAIDGMGPRGKGFHTHSEQIEVSSLALRAEALVRFLLSWGALV